MTTGGIILMASIITVFAIFSAGLAWGVHQTTVALRDRSKKSDASAPDRRPAGAQILTKRAA